MSGWSTVDKINETLEKIHELKKNDADVEKVLDGYRVAIAQYEEVLRLMRFYGAEKAFDALETCEYVQIVKNPPKYYCMLKYRSTDEQIVGSGHSIRKCVDDAVEQLGKFLIQM